jgi:hypothetical protein
MTQVIKNVSAFMGFGFVAFLHVYFVLLLLAKPALAEEKTQKVVVETTATGASSVSAAAAEPSESVAAESETSEDDGKMVLKNMGSKQFKFKINDEEGTIKIDKNGIQISQAGSDEKEEEDTAAVVSSYKDLNKTNLWADILEDVLVPIVLFLSAFGFAGYFVYAKSRTRRDYLETIKALAQSGQPIPPELLANMNATMGGTKLNSAGQTHYDANAIQGVKYIFWGIGIAGMMLLFKVGVAYAIGFLFIVMGAFHIYTSQMIQKQKATDTTAATTPEIK